MAYVLGYFIADGCIVENKDRISNPYIFNITSKDLEHLYKISDSLKSSYKISKKSGSSLNIAYQIQVRNSELARDLIKLGINPRKTYNLQPIKVPEKYFADYTRGFFDGDGSVYIYTVNGTPQIKSSFVGVSFNFIEDFNKKLCRALHIPEKAIHKSTLKDSSKKLIQYSNCFYIDDSIKLAKFMYNNCNLYLERKKSIFEKWQSIKRRHFTKNNYPSKVGWDLVRALKRLIHRNTLWVRFALWGEF